MSKNFFDLSFTFTMGLERLKRAAIKNNDHAALESLKENYLGLFSKEFTKTVEMTEIVCQHLAEKYGEGLDGLEEGAIKIVNVH